MLFKKNLDIEVRKISKDKNGRILIVNCIIQQHEMMLVNIYTPNHDAPDFFLRCFK